MHGAKMKIIFYTVALLNFHIKTLCPQQLPQGKDILLVSLLLIQAFSSQKLHFKFYFQCMRNVANIYNLYFKKLFFSNLKQFIYLFIQLNFNIQVIFPQLEYLFLFSFTFPHKMQADILIWSQLFHEKPGLIKMPQILYCIYHSTEQSSD